MGKGIALSNFGNPRPCKDVKVPTAFTVVKILTPNGIYVHSKYTWLALYFNSKGVPSSYSFVRIDDTPTFLACHGTFHYSESCEQRVFQAASTPSADLFTFGLPFLSTLSSAGSNPPIPHVAHSRVSAPI